MICYKLVKKMREIREWYGLSALEQALYYELVFICNEWRWADHFPCSNRLLAARLNVSERSIQRMRKSLLACGLISYRSRKSLKLSGVYSLTKNLATGADLPMQVDFSLLASEMLDECLRDKDLVACKEVKGEVCDEADDSTCDTTCDKTYDNICDRTNVTESYLYKTKTKTKIKTIIKRSREYVFKKQFVISGFAYSDAWPAFKMDTCLLRCRSGPYTRIDNYPDIQVWSNPG